jgi:hypothetical protein
MLFSCGVLEVVSHVRVRVRTEYQERKFLPGSLEGANTGDTEMITPAEA